MRATQNFLDDVRKNESRTNKRVQSSFARLYRLIIVKYQNIYLKKIIIFLNVYIIYNTYKSIQDTKNHRTYMIQNPVEESASTI